MTLFLSLMMACEPTPECVENTDCGQGQACITDTCQTVECMTSGVCTLGQYCDLETYTCQAGCGTDQDCWAGQTCGAEGECVVPECTDSQRDCAVGEICTNGACLDDGGSCDSCSGGCPAGFSCWGGVYCMKTCVTQSDCPAAFSCAEDQGICYNDCSWLRQNGYP